MKRHRVSFFICLIIIANVSIWRSALSIYHIYQKGVFFMDDLFANIVNLPVMRTNFIYETGVIIALLYIFYMMDPERRLVIIREGRETYYKTRFKSIYHYALLYAGALTISFMLPTFVFTGFRYITRSGAIILGCLSILSIALFYSGLYTVYEILCTNMKNIFALVLILAIHFGVYWISDNYLITYSIFHYMNAFFDAFAKEPSPFFSLPLSFGVVVLEAVVMVLLNILYQRVMRRKDYLSYGKRS